MKTIDYAIDLGTTNSLIASCISGDIEIYKNPFGHNEVLSSVVGFRAGRVLIGDKAKAYLEKDPQNVFGGFKRKMGTDESFLIQSEMRTITPIELSTYVLKELKNFLYEKEELNEVVITIPASFDTIQSNATKTAGYEAGFKNVVLLQEPIAACLAFANQQKEETKSGKWLVYDLGGGTFDVALISINEEELKVLDHKGDNFLGGLDFDRAIVNNLLIPKILEDPNFKFLEDLEKEQSIEFQKLFAILMQKAEIAKIDLSFSKETFVDLSIKNKEGYEEMISIVISQDEFNQIAKPKVDYTIQLINELIADNNLSYSDLDKIILVGGSSKMPLVKTIISESIDTKLDCSIDPTNAIVVGASYYASSKIKTIKEVIELPKEEISASENTFSYKLSYLKSTREKEEMIIAVFSGNIDGVKYRITRQDNGFDSGIKEVKTKVIEMLNIVSSSVNNFDITFYNANEEIIKKDSAAISITQGLYKVDGQPLPFDICLEVDDFEINETKLEAIFNKNEILPLRKTIYKEISKTILRDSDQSLIINILEGDKHSSPFSNQVIGCIEINSNDLEVDLIKGSDVEITLEITESRDLKVEIYLAMVDKEIKELFSPSTRSVSVSKLKEELSLLHNRIVLEFKNYENSEDYEMLSVINSIKNEVEELITMLKEAEKEVNSDSKYHVDQRKINVSQRLDKLNSVSYKNNEVDRFIELKQNIVSFFEDAELKRKFESKYLMLIKGENDFLAKGSAQYLKVKNAELLELNHQIALETFDYLIQIFFQWKFVPEEEITDVKRFEKLVIDGEKAVEKRSKPELIAILIQMQNLTPNLLEDKKKTIKGTGLA